jgi:hypothetical protein
MELRESDAQYGGTALMYGSMNMGPDCARLLIDAGADKDAKCHVRFGRCFVWAPRP